MTGGSCHTSGHSQIKAIYLNTVWRSGQGRGICNAVGSRGSGQFRDRLGEGGGWRAGKSPLLKMKILVKKAI